MKMRCFGLLLVMLFPLCAMAFDVVPDESQVVEGYESRTQVEERLSQLPLHDIEGIWQWIDNGSYIVIERYVDSNQPNDELRRYRMVVLRSPRLSVVPGTVMGYLKSTAKKDCFEACIYTDFDGATTLSAARNFTINLSDRRLSFTKQKSEIKVNLWRMVPYMFRYSITKRGDSRRGLDGCEKVFPLEEGQELTPRYL